MKILAIDTSGKVAAVAITDGNLLLAEKSVYTKLTHSQIILPMVKELMNNCELTFSDLDAVVCAKGPGSYTGLRIGIAAVKGIVMGCETLKCAGISTLESLCYNSLEYRGKILPVMRARNSIVYCGEYESDGEKIRSAGADRICTEEEFIKLVGENALLTGDACEEIKQKYFANASGVKCASVADRLQKASSLCIAYAANPERSEQPNDLAAAYLQETKAEKIRNH